MMQEHATYESTHVRARARVSPNIGGISGGPPTTLPLGRLFHKHSTKKRLHEGK